MFGLFPRRGSESRGFDVDESYFFPRSVADSEGGMSMTSVKLVPFNVYAKRLIALSDYLDRLGSGYFNGTPIQTQHVAYGQLHISCGCISCGLSHAVVLFGEECGVELKSVGPRGEVMLRVRGVFPWDDHQEIVEAAGDAMFDMNPIDLIDLFTNNCEDTTASQLAARIRKFVAERYEGGSNA
jgi:hypothetical protein